MQGPHKRFVLIALAAALLATVVAVATRAPRTPATPEPWPGDIISTYRVDWHSQASVTMSVQSKAELGTDVQAHGDLLVRSYGTKDGAVLLGVRWGNVESASIIAMGRVLVPADDVARQLAAADAMVSVERTGRVLDVRFSPATTPLAREISRALILEVCAQLAAAAGEGEVETALGRAQVTRSDGGAAVTTKRTRYDSLAAFPDGIDPSAAGTLDAEGEVDLGPDDSVVAIRSLEQIAVQGARGPMEGFQSKTELTASLTGKKKEALGPPPGYAPTESQAGRKEDGRDRRASLERRAKGVTYETLYADVRMVSVMPKSGATAWIWHDGAYLELHPEQAQKLLDQASHELDLTGQAAAFDIVVVSGTAEAQKALEAALRGWAGKDEASFVVLVQRVGYLRRPSVDTLAFVEAQYARQRGTDRGRASAYALGALALAAYEDEPDRTKAIVATLAQDLVGAKDDDDRAALVSALGNAGFDSTIDAVIAQRSSASAEVRAAVASALRKVEGRRVVDTLLELATDGDPQVAAVALSSFFRKELDDDAWGKLRRAFDEGRIPASAHETLLNGLSARRSDSLQVTALLVAIVASPDVHPNVKQRAESVLRN